MRSEDAASRLGDVISRCWKDAAFKERFLASPRAVLEEHGIDVPPGVEVQVVENTAQRVFLVLPPCPSASGELNERELDAVAGGGSSASYAYSVAYNIFTSTSSGGGGFVPVLPHPGPGGGGR
jgi:hypothetical protein